MFNSNYTAELFNPDGTSAGTFVYTEEIARVVGMSEEGLSEIVRDLGIPRQEMLYNGATGDGARVSISEAWAGMVVEALRY